MATDVLQMGVCISNIILDVISLATHVKWWWWWGTKAHCKGSDDDQHQKKDNISTPIATTAKPAEFQPTFCQKPNGREKKISHQDDANARRMLPNARRRKSGKNKSGTCFSQYRHRIPRASNSFVFKLFAIEKHTHTHRHIHTQPREDNRRLRACLHLFTLLVCLWSAWRWGKVWHKAHH